MKNYINEYFQLDDGTVDLLEKRKPRFGYNGFGEFIFYRTYSRLKRNGSQENWADVVIRVISGVMSIRKDWYIRNRIEWDERRWQEYAKEMALSMFDMKWLPPGRGLWAMGTDFIVERGSASLFNCAFTKLGGNERLANDYHWMMDLLMNGVGVGFEALRDDLKLYKPRGKYDYTIPDSREGWCDSVKLLLNAYLIPNNYEPEFDYSEIRKKGEPIKGFGGTASGPAPLITLHNDIRTLCNTIGISSLRFKTDIANKIGTCVVAGNVRRSAELAKGSIQDREFMDLKDYEQYPEREDFGWMSNNTVALLDDADFEQLGEVAKRVITRGEPGILNLRNFKYGRIGKPIPVREDEADGLNPCGEIPLIDKETCNICETLPTRCANDSEWLRACEFGTFYTSTVSLLPTHRHETNQIVSRNRRIGVGIVDVTGWIHESSMNHVIKMLREGYEVVRETNRLVNGEAGVPESIRVTTIKPGGTVPKLAGKTSGTGYPTFNETLMNVRVAANAPVVPLVEAANIDIEREVFDPQNTIVIKWPVMQGPAPPAETVSLWQQAILLATLQREWSDNAVSNTLYFRPKWRLIEHHTEFIKNINVMRETINHKLSGLEFHNLISMEQLNNIYDNHYFKVTDEYVLKNDVGYKYLVYWEKWPSSDKQTNIQLKIYKYDPNHEENIIEPVLASIAPIVKSCSLLPHAAKGVYRQMPQEGVSVEEYNSHLSKMKKIDWSKFTGSDGDAEVDKYCSGPSCTF